MNEHKLKATFLGTGTSTGVPMIACSCPVCQSENPKDKRLRVAMLIESPTTTIVIDIGPDFRQQMLREKVQQLDAVLITHEHHDHIAALDEVRVFNFKQKKEMPVYTSKRVQQILKRQFDYIFEENPYPGAPVVKLVEINKTSNIQINDIAVTPIEYLHGRLPILGFRIKDFTYLTDFKSISPEELEKVRGTKILVLSAIHNITNRRHHSHILLDEALDFIEQLQPEQAYITHISHYMGKSADIQPTLPPNVQLAWDGLNFEF